MRIGLDLDGVVADWQKSARMMLHVHRGVTLPDIESPYWDWIRDQVSKDDWRWLWSKAVSMGVYAHAPVIRGAQEFVRHLNVLGDVVVLTARPPGARRDTLDWWFGNYFPMIAGFNFFASGAQKGVVKCDVLIEDNIEYAQAWNYTTGTPVILLDKPYNRVGDFKGHRVAGYDEALHALRDLRPWDVPGAQDWCGVAQR